MGLIKDNIEHIGWVNKYGFKFNTSCVAGWCSGYERTYSHSDGLEYLWVTLAFPLRKVFLYNEYECGGLLWERELDIPDGIYSTDEYEFINWLDKELEYII